MKSLDKYFNALLSKQHGSDFINFNKASSLGWLVYAY